MSATEDIRLNYGDHAVMLSPDNEGGYDVKVWVDAAHGNTPHNPNYREVNLGYWPDWDLAREVGEAYINEMEENHD